MAEVGDYPHSISASEFAEIFNISADALPARAKEVIATADFRYRILVGAERDAAYLRVFTTLLADMPHEKISGPHRRGVWEKGWSENLESFAKSGDTKDLEAKFVKKKELIRFRSEYIDPAASDFEESFVRVLRAVLFMRYFKDAERIYEFGFGAGLNLVDVAAMFPAKKLIGLDWASSSVKIAQELVKKRKMNITGRVFDLFVPDENLKMEKGSVMFSIGTLEQIGKNFQPFTDYLIAQKPDVCINVETMYEVYDQSLLFDYVAAAYLEKRNYLRGYLAYLQELERSHKVEILEVRRTFGSFYHDGYTYIVWRPR